VAGVGVRASRWRLRCGLLLAGCQAAAEAGGLRRARGAGRRSAISCDCGCWPGCQACMRIGLGESACVLGVGRAQVSVQESHARKPADPNAHSRIGSITPLDHALSGQHVRAGPAAEGCPPAGVVRRLARPRDLRGCSPCRAAARVCRAVLNSLDGAPLGPRAGRCAQRLDVRSQLKRKRWRPASPPYQQRSKPHSPHTQTGGGVRGVQYIPAGPRVSRSHSAPDVQRPRHGELRRLLGRLQRLQHPEAANAELQ
jgi:hypothetical protein